MDKNCAYLINKKFEADGKFLLYNASYVGRSLNLVADYFEDALDYFQPTQSVVVETRRLFSPAKIKEFLSVEKESKNLRPQNSLLFFLRDRLACFNFVYGRIEKASELLRDAAVSTAESEEIWTDENVIYLQNFLRKFSEPSRKKGIQAVIFFHPHLKLQVDGSAIVEADPKEVELYRIECEKQGIIFLCMGDRFMREYEENKILPHGYWNTLPNVGHLNKDGHRMVAEELCKVIGQLDDTPKSN